MKLKQILIFGVLILLSINVLFLIQEDFTYDPDKYSPPTLKESIINILIVAFVGFILGIIIDNVRCRVKNND